MWRNPEAWIAIGVSVLFVVAAVVMHRVFVNILKNDSPTREQKDQHE